MNLKHISKLFLSLTLGSTLLLAEPSVYRFDSSNDSVSQVSGASTNSVIQNRNTIALLKRQITEQNERIDGLTSIIEGLSATMGELQGNRSSSSMGNDNTVLLKELGTMIDKINSNYVSKEEFRKALKTKGSYTSPSTSSTEKIKPEESLKGKSTAKLYSEGARLFMKKRYSEAKKRFTVTDQKGYKPAASNYYLGEIAYYTKKYEDAIFYFKKSAGLYDKASYIDVLLLHTAISLEKSGDKEQARAFYENIIENYPNKKSANISKNKLKKL